MLSTEYKLPIIVVWMRRRKLLSDSGKLEHDRNKNGDDQPQHRKATPLYPRQELLRRCCRYFGHLHSETFISRRRAYA